VVDGTNSLLFTHLLDSKVIRLTIFSRGNSETIQKWHNLQLLIGINTQDLCMGVFLKRVKRDKLALILSFFTFQIIQMLLEILIQLSSLVMQF